MADDKMIVEISCFEVWRQISDYVDNDVDRELKARLELHFGSCKHCRALLDGMRNVLLLIGDEETFELPPAVSQRITSALTCRLQEDHEVDG